MARDRKRAKQRRDRRGSSAAGRARESAPAVLPGQPADQGPAADAPRDPAHQTGRPSMLPPALERSNGDAEFDAAVAARAADAPAAPETLSEGEIDAEAELEGDLSGDELQEPGRPSGPGGTGRGGSGTGGGGADGGEVASAPSRPRVLPCGAATARSASCAPAGPSCSACSGPTAARSRRRRPSCWASWPSPALYLGLADYVAKEIVELIL